jgi:hypothetical protein
MSMEIVFFASAGFLALLSVILGISNWIFLSSISSKISNMEDEIEKKTLEMDAYKKERLAFSDQRDTSEEQTQGKAGQTGDQIEIVRNVRGGGFENYDADAGNVSPPPPVFPSTGEEQSDILDVVDEGHAASGSDAISLFLFSHAKKDTDFTAAWKQLAQILPNRRNPRVSIDFSNVMFLYDRELVYLEKFRDVVLRAGGSIAFVNCDAELAAILQKNPLLAAHMAGSGVPRR